MQICLRTLGLTGLTDEEGTPLDFPLGKPFGILVYAALSQTPATRDELAELFWSGSDPSRARHSVRQALSFIRKRLGEDLFSCDDPVELDPSRLTTDVSTLEEALSSGEAARLHSRYGGPFLADFQLAASAAWEHWVDARRRVLAERVAASFHQAAVEAEAGEERLEWLRRSVTIEPHRARHRVALIQSLLEHGQLETARAELAEARQAEIDAPELLAAAEDRLDAIVAVQARSPARDALTPEFVGRSTELSALAGAWKGARGGRREIAVVSGPTGIGKTRLTEELATLVESGDGQVAQVKASRSERRMKWSVAAELIRVLYTMPGAAGVSGGAESVLRCLVPTLGSGTSSVQPPAGVRPVAISDALADLIEAVAYEAPLLVVLDDMQWIDAASMSLLLRTARQIHDEPVLVTFTFRSDEVNAAGLESVEALVRDYRALSLRLAPLAPGEVEELLALSGLEEERERLQKFAARLYDISRGHPLFLVELLRSLQDEGTLAREGERWRLRGPPPDQLELPDSVRGVIARRLEHLGDDARRVGQELARLPAGSRIERLRVRSGLPDDGFTAALNELLQRNVVRWDHAGRLGFSHDQLQSAMAKRSARWKVPSAIAAILVLLAVSAAWASLTSSNPQPYGGGTVVVRTTAGATLLYPVTAADPSRWTPAEEGSFWVPEPARYEYSGPAPRRLTDGRVVWAGRVQDPLDAPDAVFYEPDAEPRRLIERPGDDKIAAISPDGSRMVALVENLETPHYDREFRLGSLGPVLGPVVAGPAGTGQASWSDDGRRIALHLSLARDSLLVLSPNGDRVAGFSAFSYQLYGWCGGSERLLVEVKDSATAKPDRVLLDPETGNASPVDPSPGNMATCSPDGTAVIGSGWMDGEPSWYVLDLESGQRYDLAATFPEDVETVYWVPDATPPIPERLQIGADSLRLTHGEREAIPFSLLLSDGSRLDNADAVWTSADPAVASILTDGRVSGNRVGRTHLIATYDKWLADTIPIEVTGGDQPALRMADDFEALDTTAWYAVGHPTATAVHVSGAPALELLGDGRYADGIVSREAFRFDRGATLEMDLRFPLTANELQKVTICLQRADPPADLDRRTMYSLWDQGDRLCFRYPAYELQKWSPDLYIFGPPSPRFQARRLPEDTDMDDWVRVGIQILPDGTASLWLDGERAATAHAPAALLDQDVRIAVLAGAHGTRGFIRSLRLWSEARYR